MSTPNDANTKCQGPFSNPTMVANYADETPRRVPGLADLHRMTMLLLSERAQQAAHILVVGAGGGMELKAMAEAQREWQFTGVDPSAAMLDLARNAPAPAPIVAGIRERRNDPLSRLIATRIANGLRMAVLGDNCPDTGCGVKVFRREDFLLLPCFEGMHRFLPAPFKRYGHDTINHPISHRARLKGQSKYTNWGRALVGVFDLLGVIWLTRRTQAPLSVSEHGKPS